jgi:hypothetical protein
MLFQHVSKAIKSGSVSLTQSHKYRPLDDYLISPDQSIPTGTRGDKKCNPKLRSEACSTWT